MHDHPYSRRLPGRVIDSPNIQNGPFAMALPTSCRAACTRGALAAAWLSLAAWLSFAAYLATPSQARAAVPRSQLRNARVGERGWRPMVAGVRLPEGEPGWETSAETPMCPCANASLCRPVTRVGPERVFVFHVGTAEAWNSTWREYDWSQITTVCVFGRLDPELLCHAHAHDARVTFGVDGPAPNPPAAWHNETLVDAWLRRNVDKVRASFVDGVNLDVEIGASAALDIDALTNVTRRTVSAMRALNPASHVTFDVPSEGLVQSGCGKMYGRDYSFKELASVVDFFVVMDYDSGDAKDALASTFRYISGPANDPYVFSNRTSAASACSQRYGTQLCTRAQLKGHDICGFGWCSDWEGLWLENARAGCGHAGYNNHSGAAGAFCCGEVDPCPTCFWANAALPVVKAGVRCYSDLGVPASKLVLAFPWYGYDYTCHAGDTIATGCHASASTQLDYPAALELLRDASGGRRWATNSSTPYFYYRDTNQTLHRVEYDDSESLKAKYARDGSPGGCALFPLLRLSALRHTCPSGTGVCRGRFQIAPSVLRARHRPSQTACAPRP